MIRAICRILLVKSNIVYIVLCVVILGFGFGMVQYARASSTSSFTQVINAGTLSVGIVDGSYNAVGSPSVTMDSTAFSFACQTTNGTFGTSTERIYIQNPDAADNGWVVSLAADNPTDLWTGTGGTFDFNDPTSSGCGDSADTDNRPGQMTINPAPGTLVVGECASCGTSNISKGSSAGFSEGVTDSITLLTAAASSDDIGDWVFTGVAISQTIPGEQPAANDYSIDLTLSIVAS